MRLHRLIAVTRVKLKASSVVTSNWRGRLLCVGLLLVPLPERSHHRLHGRRLGFSDMSESVVS
jgi:hypothetical protein